MNSKAKKILLGLLRASPFILIIILTVTVALSGTEVSADTLLNYAPSSPVLAALFLIAMYAFKSLSIVFPVLALNIAGGFLFSPGVAIAVNAVGMIVELSIPYLIGIASGKEYADKLCEKYPKVGEVVSFGNKNSQFMAFFLRVISCLPMDIVSIYFGACRTKYSTYIIGSFLGTVPMFVFATLLGTSITDPTSPLFWFSIGMTVGIAVISALLYYIWIRKKAKADQ